MSPLPRVAEPLCPDEPGAAVKLAFTRVAPKAMRGYIVELNSSFL